MLGRGLAPLALVVKGGRKKGEGDEKRGEGSDLEGVYSNSIRKTRRRGGGEEWRERQERPNPQFLASLLPSHRLLLSSSLPNFEFLVTGSERSANERTAVRVEGKAKTFFLSLFSVLLTTLQDLAVGF